MKQWENALNTIWNLRLSGKVSESYSARLSLISQIPKLSLTQNIQTQFEILIQNGLSKSTALSFLLLEVSFVRVQLKTNDLKKQLNDINLLVENEKIQFLPILLLQNAYQAHIENNTQLACEFYSQTKTYAGNLIEFKREKIIAEVNLALCFEDLGILNQDTVDHISKIQFSTVEKNSWGASIEKEIIGLKAREHFRKGDIEAFAKLLKSPSLSASFWLKYFIVYQNQLNFFPTQIENNKLINEIQSEVFYLNQFRSRTLQYLSIDSDLSQNIRMNEHIERLYLWTWAWLKSPSHELLKKIEILFDFIKANISQTLSYDSFKQLENASRWLGLFSNIKDSQTKSTLDSISFIKASSHAVLDYEGKLLDLLYTYKENPERITDQCKILKSLSLSENKDFALAKVAKSICEHEILKTFGFENLIQSLLKLNSDNPKKSEFRINLLAQKIYLKDKAISNTEYISLFLLFKEVSQCKKAQILEKCFGIHQKYYDSQIHNPKIALFLTKLNKTFEKYVRFSTKQDQVQIHYEHPIQWESWQPHSVNILSTNIEELLLQSNYTPAIKPPTPMNLQSFVNEWKSREDFEKALKISRATANRMITKWVQEKLLEKRGLGKATEYKAEEKAITQLQKILGERYV